MANQLWHSHEEQSPIIPKGHDWQKLKVVAHVREFPCNDILRDVPRPNAKPASPSRSIAENSKALGAFCFCQMLRVKGKHLIECASTRHVCGACSLLRAKPGNLSLPYTSSTCQVLLHRRGPAHFFFVGTLFGRGRWPPHSQSSTSRADFCHHSMRAMDNQHRRNGSPKYETYV